MGRGVDEYNRCPDDDRDLYSAAPRAPYPLGNSEEEIYKDMLQTRGKNVSVEYCG